MTQTAKADELHVPECRTESDYGNLLHPEASTAPQDQQGWYADFFEKACCAPHRDGESIIICTPERLTGEVPNPREERGWAVTKIRKVYSCLNGDHPRIVRYENIPDLGRIATDHVRYVCTLEDGSVLVEKLTPGPLSSITLPTITVPVSGMLSREDRVMLSLYYRWALQSLSALAFLHSHAICLRSFSSELVWLRSDLSLAITGFVSSVIDGADEDYGEDAGWAGSEWVTYHGEEEGGSIKEDLFHWATFVWRLMTNCHSAEAPWKRGEVWEPVCPVEGGLLNTTPHLYQILGERCQKKLFQDLEDERLGSILVKTWNGGYDSADEVAEEVRRMVELKMGIAAIGDEIGSGQAWEDIFEVGKIGGLPPERVLRFKYATRESKEAVQTLE